MIAVMQAYADGKKIEISDGHCWKEVEGPSWNWGTFDYRIKPEPKYRPYKNADECLGSVFLHGGWVRDKYAIRSVSQITFKESQGIIADMVHIKGLKNQTYEEIVSGFVWADDGSPCGVLEE